MTKREKSDVDFGRGMATSHCGPMIPNDHNYCKHFIARTGPVGACELVKGDIGKQMWCKLFERVARKSS